MKQSKLEFGDNAVCVHHQGAHLSSWVYQGKEQLFLSSKAVFEPTKAIRGGVPICFPQFGAFGPGRAHGFARNVIWRHVGSLKDDRLLFELVHDKQSIEQWPYEFKAQFEVTLNGNQLTMALSVENSSAKTIEFTAALHTYFLVDHINHLVVNGLEQCEYWDNGTEFNERRHQVVDDLKVSGMIDRVYFNTDKTLTLIDGQSVRKISSDGFNDTVVWNPWDKGATAFTDMADDEYQRMLCIESANVGTPVALEQGDVWQGSQQIMVVALER